MNINQSDTIFALATANGRAGVAIIRISGHDSAKILQKISKKPLPAPRKATLHTLFDKNGKKLDEALVLRFVAPKSFTGEDMVELHCHASPAVLRAVSRTLFDLGLRQAKPGEFTRRAFENGKMDLTEAEGLADLVDAKTDAQRQQALRQMQGGLKQVYENWRKQILDALAMIEGEIDFADEADVPSSLARAATPILARLEAELQNSLANADKAERVRDGIDIAIIGPPNAGKSSIFNVLAKREAAIVTAIAGTTRDVLELELVLAGQLVRLADTAGLRQTRNVIEAEGVRRARKKAEQADLRIGVLDINDQQEIKELQSGDILIINKTDLKHGKNSKNVSRETFYTSTKTKEGIKELENALGEIISKRFAIRENAGITRERHRNCVQKTLDSIQEAKANLLIAPELAGDDLRQALDAIRELAGESDIEAVLDRVFSQFCIGK